MTSEPQMGQAERTDPDQLENGTERSQMDKGSQQLEEGILGPKTVYLGDRPASDGTMLVEWVFYQGARYRFLIASSVVAVHGIGAHPEFTWKTNGVNWLSNPAMLPSAVPNARTPYTQIRICVTVVWGKYSQAKTVDHCS